MLMLDSWLTVSFWSMKVEVMVSLILFAHGFSFWHLVLTFGIGCWESWSSDRLWRLESGGWNG
jgi:hypothetical protein